MIEKRYSGVGYATPKGEVSGYVCRWGVPSFVPELGKKEMFEKGCFKTPRTVALLAQHNPHEVLASTKSGTLKLSEDDTGLKFTALIPEHSKITRELLERGDLCGSSAGFVCDSDSHEMGIRKVKSARLAEISLVHDGVHSDSLDYRSATKMKKQKKWTDLL